MTLNNWNGSQSEEMIAVLDETSEVLRSLKNYVHEMESKSVIQYKAEDGSRCTAYGLVSTPGFSTLLVFMEKGVTFPYHSHPYKEYFHILSGCYLLDVGGKVQKVHAGDQITIPPDCMHGTLETLEDSWTFCVGLGENAGYPGTWPGLHPDILRNLPGAA